MSGSNAAMNWRRITLPRLAFALIIVVGLFLFHDSWISKTALKSVPIRPSSTNEVPIHHEIPDVKDETETLDEFNKDEEDPLPHNDEAALQSSSTTSSELDSDPSCRSILGADRLLVLLKTGATEIYQKLPTHLVTVLECAPNFMIFSDLEQKFAESPVHDAIAPVSERIRQQHEDFELYRKIEQYHREGQDLSKLKGTGGWNLDRWKFLPMLHQAFENADDNIEWFFLMEADTSVSWTNLLLWIQTMDPSDAYYLGSENVIGSTMFAHGGSGVLISRRAADMLKNERNRQNPAIYDLKWEDKTASSCCGDAIVGQAFYEAGVELSYAWPMIQGERVSSIDWTYKHWCTPSITWHHVSPPEVDALWQFQRSWTAQHGWTTPYVFRDVYTHFIDNHITTNRTSWNNLSSDKKITAPDLLKAAGESEVDFYTLSEFEKHAIESEDKCAEACLLQTRFVCVQWMFSPGRCHLGKDVRFGSSDALNPPDGRHWTSGWILDRWNAFKEQQEPCEIKWHRADL